MEGLAFDIMVAAGMGLIGAVVFAAIGLVSGTDETTTLAPLTLIVILLGVPPVGVFTFFLAAAVAKHMTYAIPTALLGIPGDTMAMPLLQQATFLRNLGVPHIALRKMISGAIIAAFVAVPLAVLFAVLLAPFSQYITKAAPWIFAVAAIAIAYFSPGRWASIAALVPFVLIIIALQALTARYGVKLSISYFLGLAIGPLVFDLFAVLSPADRARMHRDKPRLFALAPDVKGWSGFFPNPFKVLDGTQIKWTVATAAISSATFVFSPVAMTVLLGEVVGSRVKHAYHRLTTVLTARNGVTEFDLYRGGAHSADRVRFASEPRRGRTRCAALQRSAPVFGRYCDRSGKQPPQYAELLGVPGLRHAGRAARRAGVISLRHELRSQGRRLRLAQTEPRSYHWNVYRNRSGHRRLGGGLLGLLVIVTMGLLGGLLYRNIGFNMGVQFMGYYAAVLTVPALIKLFTG